MTTTELEVKLMRYFKFLTNDIVTNITSMARFFAFETDMVVLSKSGYAHGLELKVSKSDFKKEFEKKQHNPIHGREALLINYYHKFKYFSFAFPESLTETAMELVPDCFGLYSVSEEKFKVTEIRKPTLISNYKFSNEDRMYFKRLGCLRVYNLKRKILKLEKQK